MMKEEIQKIIEDIAIGTEFKNGRIVYDEIYVENLAFFLNSLVERIEKLEKLNKNI